MNENELVELIYSEDDFDYTQVEGQAKQCLLCGKEFVPIGRNSSRQRFCKRSHYLNCLVCGKPVLQSPPSTRKEEIKQTCSRECGNKLRQMRTEEAMLAKYGVNNASQVKEFHDKAVESIKAKVEQTNEKARKTLEEKYGGIGAASPVIRAKIEATMQERYGVTNAMESEDFRNKLSESQKSSEAVQKRIQASRERYGTDFPSQSEIVQLAMKQTLLEHYGVEYSGQVPGSREKAMQTCEERYGFPCGLNSEEARKKASETMKANCTGRVSKINLQVSDQLKQLTGHEIELEKFIQSKWYDLHLLDTNILIEIDPSYTHSDLPNHWGNGIEMDYHLEKTKVAEENGFQCIHIFDWDDIEKIGNLLKKKEVIYARNCEVKKISEKEANMFIDKYHLQGKTRGTQYAFGLFYNNKLVEVMTFGKPRYNKKYEYELLRLCTHSDYKVAGGASRLFKAFVKEINPQTIISYCDRAKFNGEVYTQLNFKLDHITQPAKVWSRNTDKITDNLLRQRGFDQLFDTNYGKGTNNEELMIRDGWRSVYDCGQKVFIWNR